MKLRERESFLAKEVVSSGTLSGEVRADSQRGKIDVN